MPGRPPENYQRPRSRSPQKSEASGGSASQRTASNPLFRSLFSAVFARIRKCKIINSLRDAKMNGIPVPGQDNSGIG